MDGTVRIIVTIGSASKEVEVTGLEHVSDKIKIIREVLNSDELEKEQRL